jgi:hypothetical protein
MQVISRITEISLADESVFPLQRPTLLAKVFGCYKLTFKRTAAKDRGSGKSKSTQMNLLVMENLFYNRRFARVCTTPLFVSISLAYGSSADLRSQRFDEEPSCTTDRSGE